MYVIIGVVDFYISVAMAAVTEIVPQCQIQLPTCCPYHQQQVQGVVVQHRRYLYNSPAPPLDVAATCTDRWIYLFIYLFKNIFIQGRLISNKMLSPNKMLFLNSTQSALLPIEITM